MHVSFIGQIVYRKGILPFVSRLSRSLTCGSKSPRRNVQPQHLKMTESRAEREITPAPAHNKSPRRHVLSWHLKTRQIRAVMDLTLAHN
jgi:hypothetical protein